MHKLCRYLTKNYYENSDSTIDHFFHPQLSMQNVCFIHCFFFLHIRKERSKCDIPTFYLHILGSTTSLGYVWYLWHSVFLHKSFYSIVNINHKWEEDYYVWWRQISLETGFKLIYNGLLYKVPRKNNNTTINAWPFHYYVN